jgi:hypothetical protein
MRVRALTVSETAWIAVLPCALAIGAALLWLGPPLGHALLAPEADEALWPRDVSYVWGAAEPAKHARVAIALAGPFLLTALVLAASRWRPRLRAGVTRVLVAAGQALTLALALVGVLGQRNVIHAARPLWPAFPTWTLLLGLVLAAAGLAALRHAPTRARLVRAVRETTTRRVACAAAAALLTACWLLTAVNTEGTIGRAPFWDLPRWAMADTLGVLDGRTPLVDFYPVYGGLWAYVAAVPMAVFGSSITTFSIVMTSISGLALLAVFALLRRVVRSSALALALYLPLLATGFLLVQIPLAKPGGNAQIFSAWPMRYAGPYLLAWLTARHVDGAAPRRAWAVALAGGLVAINNLEFGLGALAGSVAALVCAAPPRTRSAALRLVGAVAGGLLGAVLLVSLLTVARTGELPRFAFLLEFPRLFGTSGFVSEPMPTAGLHLALYATFAAALVAGVTRALAGADEPLLTAMLAWSGTFGLLAGSYYAGRSDALKLAALLSAWCFALALLTVLVVRALASAGWRRPRVVEVAVLVAFGVTVGSLHELPAPWSQAARLSRSTRTPLYRQAGETSFLRAHARPHERVAILIAMGNRLAAALKLTNVSPYPMIEAMGTRRQLNVLLAAMRRERAHALFVESSLLAPEQRAVLALAGFQQRAAGHGISEWSDAR